MVPSESSEPPELKLTTSGAAPEVTSALARAIGRRFVPGVGVGAQAVMTSASAPRIARTESCILLVDDRLDVFRPGCFTLPPDVVLIRFPQRVTGLALSLVFPSSRCSLCVRGLPCR